MMAWIESHTSLAHHPKTIRFARLLGVPIPQAIGHLHLLWWWALQYAQDGQIGRFDAEELASAALYEDDPDRFLAALKRTRFVNDDDTLHDWEDYAGRLLQKRREDADRKRALRARQSSFIGQPRPGDVQRTSSGHPEDGARTVPNRTVPNRTVPDPVHTLPGIGELGERTDSNAAAAASPPGSDPTLALFAYYRARIQPRARDPSDPARRAMQARLRTWSLADLKTAIDHFAADAWYMAHHAHEGAAWFFKNDDRIERLFNLPVRREEERNGTHRPPTHRPEETAGLAALGKYG